MSTSPKLKLPAFADLPDDALVRIAQLTPGPVPAGRSTLYRMIKDGTFPKPVYPLPGLAAWHVGTVRQWLRTRSTSKDGA